MVAVGKNKDKSRQRSAAHEIRPLQRPEQEKKEEKQHRDNVKKSSKTYRAGSSCDADVGTMAAAATRGQTVHNQASTATTATVASGPLDLSAREATSADFVGGGGPAQRAPSSSMRPVYTNDTSLEDIIRYYRKPVLFLG